MDMCVTRIHIEKLRRYTYNVKHEKHNKNKNFVYFIASINNFHGHFIFY